jgi:D-sedoheptulose 7-phosphate isomerase
VLRLVQEKDCIAQAACTAALLRTRFMAGQKLLLCGNGGSAMDAQHFAAELVGRYKTEREPLPAIALTADQAILTAVANDYSYGMVFERQVHALGRPGDVLIAFSTSGNSHNVCCAVSEAKNTDIFTIAFTGQSPDSYLARAADWCIRVPSLETARIQEMHQILYHGICEALDELYSDQRVL